MPAVRTIARPPLSGSVTVHIPEEYRSYSLAFIRKICRTVLHTAKFE